MTKCELFHDNFQNFKSYHIPKAQLVIADIPYNIGVDAYASNPMWYKGGDNQKGKMLSNVKQDEQVEQITFWGDGS